MRKSVVVKTLIAAVLAVSAMGCFAGCTDSAKPSKPIPPLQTVRPEETTPTASPTLAPDNTPKGKYTITVKVESELLTYAVQILAGELTLNYDRNPGGAYAAPSSLTKIYEEGSIAEFSAILTDGAPYEITGWTGDYESNSEKLSFKVEKDTEIIVKVRQKYDNIALGKPVAAENAEIISDKKVFYTDGLTDGNVIKKFSTGTIDVMDDDANAVTPVGIVIDLGEIKKFNTVSLVPRFDVKGVEDGVPGYPKYFEIQISDDGVNYKTVRTVREESPMDCLMSYDIGVQNARFVKLNVLRPGEIAKGESIPQSYRVQLSELILFYRP